MMDVRGEVALWREVLIRALQDAQGIGQCIPLDERSRAISDAVQFLTATYGGWAWARRHICYLANVEPSAYERIAREKLTTGQRAA
jgi:hypothetical protein